LILSVKIGGLSVMIVWLSVCFRFRTDWE